MGSPGGGLVGGGIGGGPLGGGVGGGLVGGGGAFGGRPAGTELGARLLDMELWLVGQFLVGILRFTVVGRLMERTLLLVLSVRVGSVLGAVTTGKGLSDGCDMDISFH